MSGEQGMPLPNPLDIGFADRVGVHVSNQQFAIVERRLVKLGVLRYLEQNTTAEGPWGAFLEVTQGIDFAVATPYRHAGTVFMTMATELVDPRSCEQLYEFCDLSWSGVAGDDRPRPRPTGPHSLAMESLCYADISNIGRIAAILLGKQYEDELGPNARWLLDRTIGEVKKLREIGIVLPGLLPAQIENLEESLGDKAANMLLASGRFGLVGRAARDGVAALKQQEKTDCLTFPEEFQGRKRHRKPEIPVGLESQRPYDNRPGIEKGSKLYFIETRGKDNIPVSGTTMGRTIAGQAREAVEDFREPYRQGRWGKAAEDLWGIFITLLGGFTGLLSGGGGARLVVQALGTMTAAGWAARRSMRKQLKQLGIEATNLDNQTDQGNAPPET